MNVEHLTDLFSMKFVWIFEVAFSFATWQKTLLQGPKLHGLLRPRPLVVSAAPHAGVHHLTLAFKFIECTWLHSPHQWFYNYLGTPQNLRCCLEILCTGAVRIYIQGQKTVTAQDPVYWSVTSAALDGHGRSKSRGLRTCTLTSLKKRNGIQNYGNMFLVFLGLYTNIFITWFALINFRVNNQQYRMLFKSGD